MVEYKINDHLKIKTAERSSLVIFYRFLQRFVISLYIIHTTTHAGT